MTPRAAPARHSARVDVLHVTEAYGGGVQSAISRYIENSPDFRHQLLLRARPGHDIGDAPGVETIVLSGSLRSFLIHAARYIARTKPRVVHMHSSYAGLLRAALPPGPRLIYTPHSYAFLRTDTTQLERLACLMVEAALSRRRQGIAAISPYEASRAARLAGRHAYVAYLPNVVQVNDSAPEKDAQGQLAKIVTVGRIMPQKDPRFFLATVLATTKAAEWTWIGDGDATMKSELLAAGITVTGWMSNPDVLRAVAEADLYVHSAQWEGAPMTLVEAAALGTPVLVRRIQALEGLGFPFSGSSPEEAAQAVDTFLADPAFRRRIQQVTRDSAWVHSPDVQQNALRRLYS